jgi:hypothetical protein
MWTRTLLVGSIIAVLKGFMAWMTVVPNPAGWAACKNGMNRDWMFGFFGATFNVLWLWITSILGGNRVSQNLVCSDAVVSSPTYFSALFALALYDAMRVQTRKMKPHFRFLYRLLGGFTLLILVIQAAHLDLMDRRQYGAAVVLALVLTMLLYSSIPVAICVDRWLTWGSGNIALLAANSGQVKDPHDEGDVVVPMCCFPFCCLHGRYYLYTASVEEVQAEVQGHREREQRLASTRRQQAAARAEEFRVAQEENARRLLELEALIQSERQRAEAREREETQEAQQKHEKALDEVRQTFKQRIAEGQAALEKKAEEADEKGAADDPKLKETELQHQKTLEALSADVERLNQAVAEKRLEITRLKEHAEQHKKSVEQDNKKKGELQASETQTKDEGSSTVK